MLIEGLIKLVFMKNVTYLFLFIAIFTSCKDEENFDLPDCIISQIEDNQFYDELKTIKIQTSNDTLYYWMNTDSRHRDGIEYILNSDCDTVCYMCGDCIYLPECLFELSNDWKTVWEN